MDKSWKPGQPCELPPEQPDKPHSISYKIIYIWHCQFVRAGDLYLVTDVKTADRKKPEYVTETDRSAAEQQLIDEAMDVSYAAGKWETKDCKKDSDERQGIFPMTKDEASAGGAQDRCDAVQNISAAAKLVLSEEVVPPDDRPKDLGPYQPMAGGWQKLGIALGERLRTFATYGPGNHHETNAACTQAIDAFLDAIGPKAGDFASLTDPPGKKRLPDWTVKLSTLETTGNIADPDTAEPCREVALTTGYDLAISQQAVAHANTADDAGNKSLSANLNGLANYYEAKGDSFAPQTPKPGSDSLVIPRLTPTPLQEIRPPIDDDARTAWSNVGTTSGVGIPLSQRAVEYAWFFGGVIAEFDSAGQIIGSLGSGVGNTGENTGTGQSEVGPDGCPVSTPPNTLRDGAAKIGIQKLCAEAVANAATPAAAKAIKWALARLGWHYCLCAKRNEVGWADCSSFVSRAYQEGAGMHLYQGNALTVTPYHVGNHPWRRLIPFSQIQAGDLMVVNSGGHIAMQLVDGYKVHTNTHNDVSRIERTYSPSYVEATVRMIPEGA
jgi:hypothetical protein